MAGTLAPERPLEGAAGDPASPARVLRRRRPLPDSRAVLGALLVAASVVGIYAAYAGAHGGPRASYVVAAHAIRPGQTLVGGDLTRTRVDLPPGLRKQAFRESSTLLGATMLSPLEAGELVQAGQVIRKRGGAQTSELSFPIEASRVGLGLRPGAGVVARELGRAPSDREIAAYWHRLVDVNRDLLAYPADAGLIFPGQVFGLPDVS